MYIYWALTKAYPGITQTPIMIKTYHHPRKFSSWPLQVAGPTSTTQSQPLMWYFSYHILVLPILEFHINRIYLACILLCKNYSLHYDFEICTCHWLYQSVIHSINFRAFPHFLAQWTLPRLPCTVLPLVPGSLLKEPWLLSVENGFWILGVFIATGIIASRYSLLW